MKITVIGSGYVGLTTALMFCELGNKVICMDKDKNKLENLRIGQIPIYEPGLENLLKKHLAKESIYFTSKIKSSVEGSDIIYITVGTPSKEDGSSDLRFVEEVAQSIGYYQNGPKIVVNKSTVPVGTGERVKEWIITSQRKPFQVSIVSNPEFLREGTALYDALHPDRIVIGSDHHSAASIVKDLFQSIDCPKIITKLRTAELIKYTANAFLAMKISFINEISRLCDSDGVEVSDISYGIGLDHRIGPAFLKAGIGWGGSCFPKDIASLIYMFEQAKIKPKILRAIQEVNEEQITYYIEQLKQRIGHIENKNISILGVSFKPNTDDIRESPSIKVMTILQKSGAKIKVYDPIAMKNLKDLLPDVTECKEYEELFLDSDCIFLLTEWKEFLNLDWKKAYKMMKNPVIIDGRNVLDYKRLKEIGFTYYGIGRVTD